MNEVMDEIEAALTARRLNVERVEDTFNVSKGKGISAHKAHVDPRPLIEELPDDGDKRRRSIAGFARGVQHVLLEPSRSSAGEWDFVESAGGLMPSVEVPAFGLGVEAAAGKPAWLKDFPGDLVVSYFIKLDRGLRVLTEPQVDRWGVSSDRITAGARSILFHNTRNLDFQPVDDSEPVHRLRAGDGYDAARCFVVADAFYSDIDDGFRFAMPSPDHFLCVFDDTEEALGQLSQAARSVYEESDEPLTTQLYRFETSKPVLAED